MNKKKLKLEHLNVSSFVTMADIKGGADGTTYQPSVNACVSTPVDQCQYHSNQFVCVSLPTHCGTLGDLCGIQ